MNANEPPEYRYWAFISYSGKNQLWARWLHHAIETYGIPVQLVSHHTPAGEPAPKRFHPLFRDREELPASTDLGAQVKGALRASRFLIVVCSPAAAQSRWVNKEIQTFQEFGRHDRILAIIIGGEPNIGDEHECFPPALRQLEPIAADVRSEADGKTNAKLKLLAGMLGVTFDALKQRDSRRRIRRLQLTIATTTALVMVFAGLAWYAGRQRARAETASLKAEGLTQQRRHLLFRSYLATGLQHVEDGKFQSGLGWFAEALQTSGAGIEEESIHRLRISMAINSFLPLKEFLVSGQRHFAFDDPTKTDPIPSRDRRWSIVKHNGGTITIGPVSTASTPIDPKEIAETFSLWNMKTGERVEVPTESNGLVSDMVFSSDGSRVAVAGEDQSARVWDLSGQKPVLLQTFRHRKPVEKKSDDYRLIVVFKLCVDFSPDGKRLLTAGHDQTVQIWDVVSGQTLTPPMMVNGLAKMNGDGVSPNATNAPFIYAKFSPDGRRVITGSRFYTVCLWDADTGKLVIPPIHQDDTSVGTDMTKKFENGEGAFFTPDGSRFFVMKRQGWEGDFYAASDGKLVSSAEHRDSVTSKVITREELEQPFGHLSFSPDGKFLIETSSAGPAEGLRIWDVKNGKRFRPSISDSRTLKRIEITADGQLMTTTGDGCVAVWQLHEQTSHGLPIADRANFRSGSFSPNGENFVSVFASGPFETLT